jgi:hypothetical protein
MAFLHSVANSGTDGDVTTPADFLAVQLAMYSGLAMNTELDKVKAAEKARRMAFKKPMIKGQIDALVTAAGGLQAAACMSEVGRAWPTSHRLLMKCVP